MQTSTAGMHMRGGEQFRRGGKVGTYKKPSKKGEMFTQANWFKDLTPAEGKILQKMIDTRGWGGINMPSVERSINYARKGREKINTLQTPTEKQMLSLQATQPRPQFKKGGKVKYHT